LDAINTRVEYHNTVTNGLQGISGVKAMLNTHVAIIISPPQAKSTIGIVNFKVHAYQNSAISSLKFFQNQVNEKMITAIATIASKRTINQLFCNITHHPGLNSLAKNTAILVIILLNNNSHIVIILIIKVIYKVY